MIVQILLPDRLNNPTGGMGEQMNNIISVSKNIKWDIISCQSGLQKDNETLVQYFRPPSVFIDSWTSIFMLQLPLFYTAIQHQKPDIIHAFDWSTFEAGIYISKYWKIPLVVTIQLGLNAMIEDGYYKINDTVSTLMDCEYHGLIEASVIIQVSHNYASRYPFKHKTTVIPNGIDYKKYLNYNKVDLPGNNKFKLIYIGRFDYMKGIQFFDRNMIPPDVDFIIIGGREGGDDELYRKIMNLSSSTNNVFYVGPKYGQEKIDWLCSADAQIVPSIHEPFGIVGLEALASKSILISSFVGGMSDYLTEDVAIKCQPKDINSIIDAINQVKTMSNDEKQERIRRGVNICKEYSWGSAFNKLEQVYRMVLN